MSKEIMTEQEKEKRMEFLKAESIEDRTKRVLNPRINKLRKQILLLTKAIDSPRYKFSDEQKEIITSALEKDLYGLSNAINSVKAKDEIKDLI